MEGIQKVTDNGDLNVIKINDINIPNDADYLVENSMKKNETLCNQSIQFDFII